MWSRNNGKNNYICEQFLMILTFINASTPTDLYGMIQIKTWAIFLFLVNIEKFHLQIFAISEIMI